MIVHPKGQWYRKFFWIQGSAVARTWRRMLATTLLSFAVTFGEIWAQVEQYSLTTTPYVLLGVALSILLGFRNSAVYDRWWEGRKLWGGMVNITRSFSRQVIIFLDEEQTETSHTVAHQTATRDAYRGGAAPATLAHRDAISYVTLRDILITRTIAYVHALRCALRDINPIPDLERILPEPEIEEVDGRKNVPIALLEGTGRRIREARRAGRLTDYQFVNLERSLTQMTDLQGGMERIKNTPFPFSYSVLTHRLVLFYCVTLPFGIVSTVGYLTPIVVLLISHTFYGLEAIGDELEEPFGIDANDLPLDALCRTIEVDLRQAMGDEANLPSSPIVDDVLL